MPLSWEPTVPDNVRTLDRGQKSLGNARPGPMSWGPGEGGPRVYAGDGTVVFQADSTGASVVSRGALTGLTPLLDGIRSKNDDQDATLSSHAGTLDSHAGTLASHGAAIAGKADTSWVTSVRDNLQGQIDGKASDARVDTLSGNVTSISNQLDGKASNARVDTLSAQVAGKAENSRVDTLSGTVTTLAGQLAEKASNARVDTLSGQVTTLAARADGLEDELDTLKAWLTANTPYPNTVHPDSRYFLATGTLPQ